MAQLLPARSEALRFISFGSITSSYMLIGTTFAFPILILIITNGTDAIINISFDGVVNHIALLPMSSQIVDYATNGIQEQVSAGVWAKAVVGAPTTGSVYVSTFYQK